MSTAQAYPLNVGSLQTYAEAHGTYPLKVLLANGYTYNAAHQYADDVTNELSGGSYARVTLDNVAWTVAGDVASVTADDPVFAAFTGTFDTVVFFADMGADSVSPLISHIAVSSTTSTAEAQTIDLPAGKIVTYNSLAPVLSVAGVEPDEGGDVPLASLAALLGSAGGGSVEPILVTAEASSTVDLEDHYDAGRPVIVTVEGTSNLTRPEILWGDPADHVGQVVAHVPAVLTGAQASGGLAIQGASAGWHIGATPGILGDFSSDWVAGFGDLNFSATPETFELTVAGVAYTASLSTDYTGDPVAAATALLSGWAADGAPVGSQFNYIDAIADRALDVALVTTATGASATIEVTDEGTGDRLNLLSLIATDGIDEAHEGYNASPRGTGELNTGYSYTHTWPDGPHPSNKRLIVQAVDDGTRAQWVRLDTSPRSEDLPWTPSSAAAAAMAALGVASQDNVGAGLNEAFVAIEDNLGGGGGGSVATDAIFDAKGDLPVGTGANTAAKLTAGANDTILMAASGEATGLKWANASTVRTAIGLGTSAVKAAPLVASYGTQTAVTATSATSLLGTTGTVACPISASGDYYTGWARVRCLNNSGSAKTFTITIKLGSNTVLTLTTPNMSSSASARTGRFVFDFCVGAAGAVQTGTALFVHDNLTSRSAAIDGTVDMTSSVAFDITGAVGSGGTQEIQIEAMALLRHT